jgi:CRISPR type III-B/RAMP module-associated protein Cmr5
VRDLEKNDNILTAIKDFDYLLNSLKERENSKVGESFRSRCREFPSFMIDVGFVPALSFCYAKASKAIYDEIKEKLKKEKLEDLDENESTKKGYAIYLYFILKRLSEYNLIKKEDVEDPVEALKELSKKGVTSGLLYPYILQLKRLSEAVFKSER